MKVKLGKERGIENTDRKLEFISTDLTRQLVTRRVFSSPRSHFEATSCCQPDMSQGCGVWAAVRNL